MTGELTDREKTVLHYVVQDFIETATPIASRYISRRHEEVLGLSSASIRNVMSDLEEMGYIGHPHTSSGRVPTDLGYRFYLNRLMEMELARLSEADQNAIRENLSAAEEQDEIFRESSKVLAKISRQLCIVTSPHISSGTFDRLELVPLTGNRVMVIIAIKSGLVRTIMMEVASEIRREKLEDLSRFLNERLSGLSLQEIRETFSERVRDAKNEETGLIRLFIDSVDKLFVPGKTDRLHIGGTETIIEQPEFASPTDFRSVIELVSNEEIIIHILEKHEAKPNEIRVTIGEENEEKELHPYSVITTTYSLGDVAGTVGVIGPRRMPYSKMIPLVEYVAKTITDMFLNSTRA